MIRLIFEIAFMPTYLFVMFVTTTAFGEQWAAALERGQSGRRLPRWWADVIVALCIIFWPLTLILGVIGSKREGK